MKTKITQLTFEGFLKTETCKGIETDEAMEKFADLTHYEEWLSSRPHLSFAQWLSITNEKMFDCLYRKFSAYKISTKKYFVLFVDWLKSEDPDVFESLFTKWYNDRLGADLVSKGQSF